MAEREEDEGSESQASGDEGLTLGDLLDELEGSEEEEILLAIGRKIRERWGQEAEISLHTSLGAYLAGLSEPILEGGGVAIELQDEFPNWIESGHGPVDLRRTLLRSGLTGVKTSKAGVRYRDVPITDPRGETIIRRISENSTGWQHPGIKARNFAERVKADLPRIVDEAVAEYLASL